MYHIQELMKSIEVHESSGICDEMPPIITPIFKSTTNLNKHSLRQSCQLALSKCHVPKVNQLTKAPKFQE